jgi:hypothetical protein
MCLMAAVVALIASAVWAFALSPIPSGNAGEFRPLTAATEQESKNPEAAQAIDAEAFVAAKLWNPKPLPPAPIEPKVEKTEPKPLRLQLVGIINEGGDLQAALYDQDEDRIVIVKSGEQIKQNKVMQITSAGIEISDGHSTQTLRLEVSGS